MTDEDVFNRYGPFDPFGPCSFLLEDIDDAVDQEDMVQTEIERVGLGYGSGSAKYAYQIDDTVFIQLEDVYIATAENFLEMALQTETAAFDSMDSYEAEQYLLANMDSLYVRLE